MNAWPCKAASAQSARVVYFRGWTLHSRSELFMLSGYSQRADFGGVKQPGSLSFRNRNSPSSRWRSLSGLGSSPNRKAQRWWEVEDTKQLLVIEERLSHKAPQLFIRRYTMTPGNTQFWLAALNSHSGDCKKKFWSHKCYCASLNASW